ncbi:MAG TPA: hypothetical protein VGD94_23535 [Vicinamibacterales bacterium]
MGPKRTKNAPGKDPVQMARDLADRFVGSMTAITTVGDRDIDALNDGIDAIQDRIQALSPSDAGFNDAGFDEATAREAGYLVGVQVGLRLRGLR